MLRLSDIMSHAGLAGYAVVALVLFVVAFLGILARVLSPRRRRELEDIARLPFADGGVDSHDPGGRP